jgi:hypothetical protein
MARAPVEPGSLIRRPPARCVSLVTGADLRPHRAGVNRRGMINLSRRLASMLNQRAINPAPWQYRR